MPTRLERFRTAERAARRRADQEGAPIADAYRRQIAAVYRSAAKRLERSTVTASASWHVPDAEELVPLSVSDALAKRSNDRARLRVIETFLGELGSQLGVALDVSNPLVSSITNRVGQRITTVDREIRRDVMAVVRNAYDQGLSIPDAAEAIRSQALHLSEMQARRIARTEIIGLVNAASVASARVVDVAAFKTWMSAQDSRVRPDHEDADGQTVPIDQPFLVGGDELQYPGDQSSASAEEVVNCRCTLGYTDDPSGLTAGGAMPTTTRRGRLRTRRPVQLANTPPGGPGGASTPARWRALSVPEGVWTSDGRMIDAGATEWRALPLTLMAQFQTDVGHDGARIAGRVDAFTRNDQSEVWSEGVFDTGADGEEAQRLVADGTLRGLSVDLADMDVEVEWIGPDGNPVETDPDTGEPVDPEAEIVDVRMRATRAVIMGQTVTPFPAFEDARIELLDVAGEAVTASATSWALSGGGRARLTMPLRSTTAAAVTEFSGSMIAAFPLRDEAQALALDGGQPSDQLHVTLAFIPADSAPAHETLVAAVEQVAGVFGAIIGEATGAGHFAAGDDGTPIVALVDAYGLDRLRTAVLDALDAQGVAYSTDHGFLPHVTLSYADGVELPDPEAVIGLPLSFFSLSVVTGNAARTDLPLQSAVSGSGGPPQRPPTEPPPTQNARRALPTDAELATAQRAIDAGLVTIDEARSELFGLPPITAGSLPRDVDPHVALVAAAIDAVTRAAAPQPVHVPAPDLSPIGAALEAVAAAITAGNEQIRTVIAATPAPPAPIFVVERGGGTRRIEYVLNDEGRVIGAQLGEEQ